MLELFLNKNGRFYAITDDMVAEVGDSIVLAIASDAPPFVSSLKPLEFILTVMSPIGTIVDNRKINLSDTGHGFIYSFPVLPTLYSGAYVFQLTGEIENRWKVYIKTSKQLRYNWQLYYLLILKNPNLRPINNIEIDVVIPPPLSPFQQVHYISTNLLPREVRIDKQGNSWLRFFISQLSPQETLKIAYRCIVTTAIVAYDIDQIKEEQQDYLYQDYPEIYEIYTAPEPFIESNHPKIQSIAAKFSHYPPISRVYAFLRFIHSNITFRELDGEYGAAFAIEKRIGDCTELASLFVSLCRAANIPARLVTAIVPTQRMRWEQHAQAEFFMNGIWIPIDPTLIDNTNYLVWNPECIILQRGNFLSKTNVKEVRYRYDNMGELPINIYLYKDAKVINQAVSQLASSNSFEDSSTLSIFSDIKWKFKITVDELIKNNYYGTVEIKPVLPQSAPSKKPFKIPVHIYNNSKEEVKGTLKIMFQRGGGNIVHLIYRSLPRDYHELLTIMIPATNYLGDTIIEFIFQNEKGVILGYKAEKIKFQ